jgi:GntR family transcriptional regulator
LPAHLLPHPEQVKESLYAYLESKGLRPVRALQRLRSVAASRQEAELLGLRAGEPVLYIERLSYLADGSVLEFTRSHYRGDRYDFVAELRRA